jgi:UDP-N-acetylmuramoyl-L-alanyl-D-glutamate--2,6-diaminopimelate ligase
MDVNCEAMHLNQFVSQISAKVDGTLDREITGITYDSRRITPGMLFAAIPGRRVDGHDYIHHAIDRGAIAVLCERDSLTPPRVTRIEVPDVREALAVAAALFHGHPSTRLKLIGVTGTNGKTTVAFMIKHILEATGLRTGLIGTVRYEIGDRVFPAERTTPEAPEVQQMLAHMIRAGCQACVMEVSSHALDQKRVYGIEFDAAIFTNLTRDHLDYHCDLEQYFAAKKKLFTSLESGAKRGGVVINIDDQFGERLSRETKAEIKMTYGLGEAAQVRAIAIELGKGGTAMSVELPEGRFDCQFPLIGRHNVYNALAAIGAGMVMKTGVDPIQRALKNMEPVPGRLESVAAEPFGVYVDYAHTDDALHNVLTTLREITPGKLLLSFGCGGNRDKGKRARMGRVAAQEADFTIITSDNPRQESPAQIAAEIEAGYRSVRSDRFKVELDRRRAIEEIIRLAGEGDSVLIAGKGHETYQEFEDTVVPFDDRVYARESIEALRGRMPKQDYASRHL